MSRARHWTCQRQAAGRKCGHRNPSIKRNCVACSKPRPKRVRPAHTKALDLPYETYVQINGGEEVCGICGRPPSDDRKLDRDHEHSGAGRPRGLLCHFCNRQLGHRIDAEWLRAAADYLERAA